ncbi:uncharacterized protein SPSK_00054 [Sporothrix schenckii 1099-18]|uniref:DUF7136 domain-containing protein n=2 Tax=Sporothrix schenckii TaxID=29908 RepID=U7PNT9_SPOS1|nr:uncharacterized protein SPSK_00054 [Sporothrix schenckii 1099-18]ERS96165.1 hypothetical protein HMPREF1624_07701 [Sporothrix schenckii ATCC 58251]KJR79808.1 hypothetical protein SPSK_00054 [Sporothrix schenckii 1099-18]
MSFRRAALLLATAWALPAIVTVNAITFPQTVEVDLVFPRNETYAPSPIFPVVFAFQNPALAPALDPDFSLNLWVNVEHNTSIYLNSIDLTAVNFTSTTAANGTSEPLFVYTYAVNLNTTSNGADPVTRYNLVWAFGAGNCSAQEEGGPIALGGGFRSKNVIFSIAQSGGAAPDIAGGEVGECSHLTNMAFNLTDILPVADVSKNDGHDTCAVLSDTTPLPVGNPCAATADAAVAASISAAATSHVCAAVSPAISCPSKNSGAALSVHAASAWAVAALATMILL